MKKYLTWAGIAFVAFFLLSSPEGAADIVQSAGSGIMSAANSLSTFVTALSS